MNCYVITLNAKYTDSEQYKQLTNIGLNVNIVPGVLATDKDLKNYPLRPKRAIGATLAHKNAWKEISLNDDKEAIILEDDAYPIIDSKKKMTTLINNAKQKAKDYDILKLHDEAGNNLFSIAVYILTKKISKKLIDEFLVVSGYADLDLWITCKLNNYKFKCVDSNLFYTDETQSNSRIGLKKRNLFVLYMDSVHPNDIGSKTYNDIYNYYGIRINNNELTVRELAALLITIIFLILLIYKQNKSECLIIYILFLFIFYANLF